MSVSIQDFGKSTSGQTVKLATLKNDFIEVQLLSYAAIIHRIIVKDRKGNPVDVVLGYDRRLKAEPRQHGRRRGPLCQPHCGRAVPAV